MLVQSKINNLKKQVESKKMEGEMFVIQMRDILSPVLEFDEIESDRAELAMQHIVRLQKEIKEIKGDIKTLNRKLGQ
jgi:predicted RNase H-like nuclease (RuvC/YqgF family)